MNGDAQSVTGNNHAKSCRSPVLRIHKTWVARKTYIPEKTLKNSDAPIIITGDSIATGLRRYKHVWRNYFKDAVNLGISGDHVENVLWRARDISLQHTTSFVIIHCGTNNVDQNQLEDIAAGTIKIAKTFTKKHQKINTIILAY